jgi:hypothetical protein
LEYFKTVLTTPNRQQGPPLLALRAGEDGILLG